MLSINMSDANGKSLIPQYYVSEAVPSIFFKLNPQQDLFRKPSSALGTRPKIQPLVVSSRT